MGVLKQSALTACCLVKLRKIQATTSKHLSGYTRRYPFVFFYFVVFPTIISKIEPFSSLITHSSIWRSNDRNLLMKSLKRESTPLAGWWESAFYMKMCGQTDVRLCRRPCTRNLKNVCEINQRNCKFLLWISLKSLRRKWFKSSS